MNLPSNVPRYNSVPLVAFDFLERRYLLPDSTRRGWPKVAEVERRLDAFEWLVHVARDPQGIGSFVRDFAMAFLLSFESALQVLQADLFDDKSPVFEQWLRAQNDYDLVFRGLRTLRNIDAHIAPGSMSNQGEGGHSRFVGGEGGSTLGWRWAQIQEQDFLRLKGKKITIEDLPAFNRILADRLAMEIMRDALQRLIRIHHAAETRR